MSKPQRRLLDKKTAFLAAFVACADLTRAAATVGIDRSEHYRWLKGDPTYGARFEAARAQAQDALAGGSEKQLSDSRIAGIARREATRIAEHVRDRTKENIKVLRRAVKELRAEIAELRSEVLSIDRTKRASKADRASGTPTAEEAEFDKIAQLGVFGRRYKSFRDAPAAVQHTIRALAAAHAYEREVLTDAEQD